MYQSTILATHGARLVIDLAGLSSENSVLILSDKIRWLETEAIAGECLAIGAHPLQVDLTYMAAWYYANLKHPKIPHHLVSAFNASNFTLAVVDNVFCHMLGHLDENRAAQKHGMRWISVEDYMCEWDIDMGEIDKFIERTHLITKMLSTCDQVRVTTQLGQTSILKENPGPR